MSLNDRIAAATSSVFANKKFFGESMTLYPKCSGDAATEFDGVFDQDSLPGTNEADGDGVALNRNNGRHNRDSASVEIPIELWGLIQNKGQDPSTPDIVKSADGRLWAAKRVMGKDDAMFTLLVVRATAQQRISRRRSG